MSGTELDDVTEDVVEDQFEEESTDQVEQVEGEDKPEDSTEDASTDEVVVSIGEQEEAEDQPQKAPDWVREVRKRNRELEKQNRELQQRLQSGQSESRELVLGEKPKLEDFDFEADKFEAALEAWQDRRRAIEDKKREEAQAQAQAQAAWQARVDAYEAGRSSLKVPDYEDAEETVKDVLSVIQQGIILNGADNPNLVVYALGKNPEKLQGLAGLTDPVKFAFQVAKLEAQMKVTTRKTNSPPPPEKTVRGTAPVSGTVESQLERLREAAAKTGDFTQLHKFKQQLRDKAKK